MGLKYLFIGAGLQVLAYGFLIWVAMDYLSGDFQETRVYEQLQYWSVGVVPDDAFHGRRDHKTCAHHAVKSLGLWTYDSPSPPMAPSI